VGGVNWREGFTGNHGKIMLVGAQTLRGKLSGGSARLLLGCHAKGWAGEKTRSDRVVGGGERRGEKNVGG